jgi:hypothetical protein
MTNPKDLKLIALGAPPASSALSPQIRTVLGDTGYRANLDAFAAQMEVFGRMRDTEHAFRQRAKAGRP